MLLATLLCQIFLTLTFCGVANPTTADFMDSLLDPSRYDKRVRPGFNSSQPVIVFLDMFVNTIGSIDEVKMEYAVNIFMRQRWIDDRLTFQGDEDITMNYNLFDRLWVPDLFVKNEKKAIFHDITVPNRLLKLSPNGQVYYSQRLSLTLNCNMNLRYYPMDNQTCAIELESYGYTTKDIVFQWRHNDPVQMKDGLELPEFLVTNMDTGDCTTAYITGSFTCLYTTIHLRRQFQYYLIQTFVPSILIVALSWVSFWIDIYAVPARVTLGLLTVLTMTTQSSGISTRLPRVSYIKAIDVWMTCCLVFVFGGLIEYSIVNVLARNPADKLRDDVAREKDDEQEESSDEQNSCPKHDRPTNGNSEVMSEDVSANTETVITNGNACKCNLKKRKSIANMAEVMHIYGLDVKNKKKKVRKFNLLQKVRHNPALAVDMVSRVLFPAIFLVFNLIFWTYYKINANTQS